ncbi:hypothetical protein ACFYSF_42065 [Streptomyces canus]|uniref:hypothetical protein n=1 Tax=Streptomyces canus TaxID=58343 RepID=UPI00369A128F
MSGEFDEVPGRAGGIDDPVEVCTGQVGHTPAALARLVAKSVARRAEQHVGAGVVVPAVGDRDLPLVVGQGLPFTAFGRRNSSN